MQTQPAEYPAERGRLVLAMRPELRHADGKGLIGRLINDHKLADNVATFIANMKAHGPVFYHDDTSDDTDGKKHK